MRNLPRSTVILGRLYASCPSRASNGSRQATCWLPRGLTRKVRGLAVMRALYFAGSATCLGITSHTNAALTTQTAATSSIAACSPPVYAAW